MTSNIEIVEKLLDQINDACRDLPEGYIINLGIEQGAAWVELLTPNYKEFGFGETIDGADRTLAEQIKYAVQLAIEDQTELQNDS